MDRGASGSPHQPRAGRSGGRGWDRSCTTVTYPLVTMQWKMDGVPPYVPFSTFIGPNVVAGKVGSLTAPAETTTTERFTAQDIKRAAIIGVIIARRVATATAWSSAPAQSLAGPGVWSAALQATPTSSLRSSPFWRAACLPGDPKRVYARGMYLPPCRSSALSSANRILDSAGSAGGARRAATLATYDTAATWSC